MRDLRMEDVAAVATLASEIEIPDAGSTRADLLVAPSSDSATVGR